MEVALLYTASAVRDLKKIDRKTRERIIKKLEFFCDHGPSKYAKALTGDLNGLYRFRVGRYRAVVLFENEEILTVLVLRIAGRKDVYS